MMVRHFAAVLALACSACGIKGPLYLPPAAPAAPAATTPPQPAPGPSNPPPPSSPVDPEKKPASGGAP
jgi:predicted small lipoprotein YifL